MSPEHRPARCGTVYVLSPHPDDACFSIALAICAWHRAGLRVRIVTCFTRSAFVRGAAGRDAAEVTRLRAAEDRAFARAVGIPEPLDLGGVDAPLRRGLGLRAVFHAPFDARDEREIESLVGRLRRLPDAAVLVAPLALGGHLDHRLVRDAAVSLTDLPRAFYEDLPYAATLREPERIAAAARVAARSGRALAPVVVRWPDGVEAKRGLARCYPSQLRWRDLALLAAAARRHGGGERLWLEAGSRALEVEGA